MALARYCDTPATTGIANRFNLNGKLTPGMINSLRGLSDTLVKDGANSGERVFQEVRVTPMELDGSIRNFIA